MASATPSSSSTDPTEATDTKAFERWRQAAAQLTGLGLTDKEKALREEEADWKRCENWKQSLMAQSPSIAFMLQHLKRSGCPTTSASIHCMPCDATRSGGFSPANGILLCQNRFFSKRHMEDTLAHELVHLYDHCTFDVDWANLRHHACSEIRAASLSGDCRFSREIRRGVWGFAKQHQACVRRRAILSVMANPACPNEAEAEKVVGQVWESCFADTRPFDEIY